MVDTVHKVVECGFSSSTSYIQEINPEMLELAKFAKQHIPEEHELDDPDFVDKRSASIFC
jgi:hypothetical protein